MATFARISGYDREDREWFESLCRTRALVLDDFGAEYFGPFGKAMLEELVMRRHAKRLRTVLTSNLDLEAIKARLDVRLYDRIRVTCVVGVEKGDSLRTRPSPLPNRSPQASDRGSASGGHFRESVDPDDARRPQRAESQTVTAGAR